MSRFSLESTAEAKHQVKGGLLLDVVVGKSASVLKLLSSEDESLLVWWDALLVLDLGFDVFDSVAGFNFESDGLSGQSLYEDLHSTAEAKHQVKGGLLLDVVVAQRTTVFQLFAGKDEPLLVWRDALLVLNLGFDVFNRVACFNLESNRLSRERLDKDLHSTTKPQNQVKGRLLLDVVVRKSASVLKLLSSEDESLLVWWDALLVLNLGLDVFDSVAGFNFESDGLSSQSLYEDLHSTAEAKHQVKGGLLLDVVVAQRTTVFQLFAGEDQSLLVWWDALLVLNLGLDVLNGVAGLDFESDGLSGKRLDENLHSTAEAKHQVKGGLLLDVVVGKSASVLKLLSSEDESLLVWWDALLVLDLGLDVFDSVAGLDFEGDGFAGQGFHEDLHGSGLVPFTR